MRKGNEGYRERIEYVGWTYEGKRHVKKILTIVGEIVSESDKKIVVKEDGGIQATIRKALILERRGA